MKTAFIFPGQGAQYAGMGQDFYENFPESKAIFDQAQEILGLDMKKLIFTENDKLNITEYTQAAMITTIAAMLVVIKSRNIPVSMCAGLSLGEYAALIMSEAIDPMDAIRLVRKRGIYMQEAVPTGKGMMAAVLGMDNEAVEDICQKTLGIVTVANYNCPGQVVISGECDAVKKAMEHLNNQGAKRVLPLNVSGPFHSPLLIEAGEKLRGELKQITFKNPKIAYVANTTAEFITNKEPIPELLAKQVYSSVRWQQSVEAMIAEGVEAFVEIGPGKTLSSFVKKIDRSKLVINIDKVSDLKQLEQLT